MPLKVLKTCSDKMDAELIRARLKADGIQSILDAGMAGIEPIYNIAVGGIKVLVKKEDIEKAKEILRNINQNPSKIMDLRAAELTRN